MKKQIEKTKIDLRKNMKKWWLFARIKDRFFTVPSMVRYISLSVFTFMLWWWIWWDTFYSIFVESIIDNIFIVSVITAILPLIKMFFAPVAWELNDDLEKKQILIACKILYIISSILYVIAWCLKNQWILLLAVLINWICSSIVFVTYHAVVHENCNKNHSESSWWLFMTWYNWAYVVWALISAILIQFMDLPYLYIFIAVFSFLSLFIDLKLKLSKKWTEKSFSNKFELMKYVKKKVFSIMPMRNMIYCLKKWSKNLRNGLWYEILWALLDYLSLLFIPLIALEHWLVLRQIALIFAMMRLPYIFNLFTSWFDEWMNKKLFIAIILLILAWLFALLWFNLSFVMILIVSFLISFWLSVIKPVISALITQNTEKSNISIICWAEQVAIFVWDVIWSIWFWAISSVFSMDIWFFLVWISLTVLACLSFYKRWKEKVKKITNK